MSLARRIDAAIDAALGSRIVGCVVLVSIAGRAAYSRAAGYADRELGIPVTPDTVFRLASVSKPIVSTAALRMIAAGRLSLDERVGDALPYFRPKLADGSRPAITVRHLLTHISGLTYQRPDDVTSGLDARPLGTLSQHLARYATQPLAFSPGSAFAYGMSIDVLGGVLEAVDGQSLAGVVATYVTEPLGMTNTGFVADPASLATAYLLEGDQLIRMGEPQLMTDQYGPQMYSPARATNPLAPQMGGAALSGRAAETMALFTAVAGDFLPPELRAGVLGNQIDVLRSDDGQGFSFLGATIEDHVAAGWPRRGVIHWGGVWGNNWMIDPATNTILVAFTNTMPEGNNGQFRTDLRNALFA